MQYAGELLDGKMHGKGVLIYPTGVKYEVYRGTLSLFGNPL
jgi:hypothetical protein